VLLDKKVEAVGCYVLQIHFQNPVSQGTKKTSIQKKSTEQNNGQNSTTSIEIKVDAAQEDQDKPKPNQRHQTTILKMSTRMQMQVSLCFHRDCLLS